MKTTAFENGSIVCFADQSTQKVERFSTNTLCSFKVKRAHSCSFALKVMHARLWSFKGCARTTVFDSLLTYVVG